MNSVRVAAVQAEPVWFDLDGTTSKTVALIEEAARGGAELVAFPETWLPGYPLFLWGMSPIDQIPLATHYRANSARIDGPEVARIRAAARENGITVVVGLSERDGGSLYMAQLLISPDGDILLHRRKLKPTHVERTLFGESDGSGLVVVETPLGRLGALNCWEHLQPLVKYTMFAQHEQIHVAAWPAFGDALTQLSGEPSLAVSRTYAMEGSVFVLVSNLVVIALPGAEGLVSGGGVARIYGPDGALLSEPIDDGVEGIAYADLDLAAIEAAKGFADPVGHYSRPDVFQLTVDRSARSVITFRDTDAGDPSPMLEGLTETLEPAP